MVRSNTLCLLSVGCEGPGQENEQETNQMAFIGVKWMSAREEADGVLDGEDVLPVFGFL
jgi:hypothetical protein